MTDVIGIQIRLASALGQTTGNYAYRLCDVDVVCDMRMPSLVPFETVRAGAQGTMASSQESLLSSPGPVRYETAGFTGGRDRRVFLETGPHGAEIGIAGVGCYTLAPDASVICLQRVADRARFGLVEECTLGAPLIVALALRDCWFLHAAAVAIDDRAAVIAGSSGSGKSTLAARLNRRQGWHRIADDLVALRFDEGSLVATSDYPQLKLPASSQSRQGPVRVDTIYLLRPAAAGERFGVRKIEKSEKLIALARHGVAARLFPAGLLDRHLAFCRAAAEAVNMVEVTYPHTVEALHRAVEVVSEPAVLGTP